jgi:hypothetical protein
MKHFAFLLITVSAILGLLYVNSFILKDRTFFIPSPENVTEGFTKKLEAKHFKLALNDVSENSPYKNDPESLKELEQRIQQYLGKYEVHRGKSRFTGESALSNVSLEGMSETLWPVFLLVEENGLWKIEKLVTEVSGK